MTPERIDFPRILQETLRDVVRRVLEEVAEHGLPDFDYFYISFRSDHPGVEMAAYLRERYPQEMTVVMQHQFWDLEVDEDSFGITLQFNTVPQRLVIPFAALTAFVDPPAEFALRFDGSADETEADEAEPAPTAAPEADAEDAAPGPGASVIRFPSRRK